MEHVVSKITLILSMLTTILKIGHNGHMTICTVLITELRVFIAIIID